MLFARPASPERDRALAAAVWTRFFEPGRDGAPAAATRWVARLLGRQGGAALDRAAWLAVLAYDDRVLAGRAFRGFDPGRGTSVETWLRRVVVNHVRDGLRKTAGRPRVLTAGETLEAATGPSASSSGPDLLATVVGHRVYRALFRLYHLGSLGREDVDAVATDVLERLVLPAVDRVSRGVSREEALAWVAGEVVPGGAGPIAALVIEGTGETDRGAFGTRAHRRIAVEVEARAEALRARLGVEDVERREALLDRIGRLDCRIALAEARGQDASRARADRWRLADELAAWVRPRYRDLGSCLFQKEGSINGFMNRTRETLEALRSGEKASKARERLLARCPGIAGTLAVYGKAIQALAAADLLPARTVLGALPPVPPPRAAAQRDRLRRLAEGLSAHLPFEGEVCELVRELAGRAEVLDAGAEGRALADLEEAHWRWARLLALVERRDAGSYA